MGEKTAARRTAQAAEVPIVPGAMSDVEDDSKASEMAEQLGYPVLLKAAAGGGGKGIRFVRDPKDLLSSLRTARSEACSAFGDGRVYIEGRFLRHATSKYKFIADTTATSFTWVSANVSIQRRHQKLIEESPFSCARRGSARADDGGHRETHTRYPLCQCWYGGIFARARAQFLFPGSQCAYPGRASGD